MEALDSTAEKLGISQVRILSISYSVADTPVLLARGLVLDYSYNSQAEWAASLLHQSTYSRTFDGEVPWVQMGEAFIAAGKIQKSNGNSLSLSLYLSHTTHEYTKHTGTRFELGHSCEKLERPDTGALWFVALA